MDLKPFKLDIDELLGEFTEGNYLALADFKTIWIERKFSYIFNARPVVNSAFFMQSLYTHCIGHMISAGPLSLSWLFMKSNIERYLHMSVGADLERGNYKKMLSEYEQAKAIAIQEAEEMIDIADVKHLIENKEITGNVMDELVNKWDTQKDEYYEKTGIIRLSLSIIAFRKNWRTFWKNKPLFLHFVSTIGVVIVLL